MTVDPAACGDCGVPQRTHFLRWSATASWHSWRQPSDAQVLSRMSARRAVRGAVEHPNPKEHG